MSPSSPDRPAVLRIREADAEQCLLDATGLIGPGRPAVGGGENRAGFTNDPSVRGIRPGFGVEDDVAVQRMRLPALAAVGRADDGAPVADGPHVLRIERAHVEQVLLGVRRLLLPGLTAVAGMQHGADTPDDPAMRASAKSIPKRFSTVCEALLLPGRAAIARVEDRAERTDGPAGVGIDEFRRVEVVDQVSRLTAATGATPTQHASSATAQIIRRVARPA